MGRHSADESAGRSERAATGDVAPVTDPRLFDGPLPGSVESPARTPEPAPTRTDDALRTPRTPPSAEQRMRFARPQQPTQDRRSMPFDVHASAAERPQQTPGPVPPVLQPGWRGDEEARADEEEVQAFEPRSVRVRSEPIDPPLIPNTGPASLLGTTASIAPASPAPHARYARTGPIDLPEIVDAPRRTDRRRELSLAAAALLAVGVMAGAAAVLPSGAADARSNSTAQLVSSSASPSASSGQEPAASASRAGTRPGARMCHAPSTSPSASGTTAATSAPVGRGAASVSTAPSPSVSQAFEGKRYRAGMVLWQTTNVTLDDPQVADSRNGIDFQRAAGRITLNRPSFSHNRLYDLRFATDRSSAQVVINDPVLPAGAKIRVALPHRYRGSVNEQQRSDIRVFVGGVDRTAELLRIV